MFRTLSFSVLLLLITTTAVAQDPFVVAPESYQLQFENDWVKVTRVNYRAGARVAVHNHVRFPTVFVYLNDAGPVHFTHEGWQAPLLVRPAVKARSLRLAPTPDSAEVHSVTNVSRTGSEFLRIEIKTPTLGREVFFTRLPPDDYDRSKPFNKYIFNNDQFRISRHATPRKTTLTVASDSHIPFLIILLTDGEVDGNRLKTGQSIWVDRGSMARLKATGSNEFEIIQLEFRIAPKPKY
jgi:hypothetical protein